MTQFVENSLSSALVVDAIQAQQPETLWVAYSGGVDSHLLLVETVERFADHYAIKAIHVNHQLQPLADQWQEHCRQVCESLNVPMISKVVMVSKGASLEAQARSARYRAFAETLSTGDVLLLGHHQDDVAETVLFRLLRGAGLKGLSGIAFKRDLTLSELGSKALLVRPFLTVTKQQIINKAKQLNLAWVEDSSNQETRMDRNFLRNHIFPLLQQRWPRAQKTLASSANLLLQQGEFFDELLGKYLEGIVVKYQTPAGDYTCLPADIVSELSWVKFYEVIRCWLDQHAIAMPSTKAVEQLFEQIKHKGEVRLDWQGGAIYQFKQLLFFESDSSKKNQESFLPVKLDCWQDFNGFKCYLGRSPNKNALPVLLSKDQISGLQWKIRAAGLRCHPAQRSHSQSLKKVMQEMAVLPWLRNQWPLLMGNSSSADFLADGIIAMPGYFINKPFAIFDGEESQNESLLYLTIWGG